MKNLAISDTDFLSYIYSIKEWEPADIDHDIYDDDDIKWDEDLLDELERRNNQLRKFNKTYNKKSIDLTMTAKEALEHDIIKLVANQISDKLTIYFNNTRRD